ncbi:uncharacterized protein LOC9650557 [Selaginella moellendorffii]|nr:uncharacterized protein LOC9650557 [Selaginella moellendorffii]|eukprot:XP_002968616.2 uncharacterized protein LOC9650557 [Selaginella moellendorffii]
MRRIFPGRNSAKDDRILPGRKDDLARVKQPMRKERSPAASAANAAAAAALSAPDSKNQESLRRSSISDRNRRTHWCPSCPSGPSEEAERCDTPPSGDENVSFTRDGPSSEEAMSQFRLGLPEECQDKQILRPSINAAPSPEPCEWTSGLQAALDQLVVESRQELRSKYVSEPPSPATSPPSIAMLENLSSTSSDVSQSVDLVSHSVDLPRPKFSRSLSRSSNDGASIMSNPRSHSFSDWSSRGTVVTTTSDKAQVRYLSARAVAERLAKAIRGNTSKTKELSKRLLPPVPQTPPRSSESIASHSASKGGGGGNGKQIIEGLQQSLSDMTHALNTQNSRIQRLTGRNEELFRLYRGKERELTELQTRVKDEDARKRAREEELKQVKDKLKYVQEKFHAQSSAQSEASRLRRLLESATDRISELELQVKERGQKVGSLEVELKHALQELNRYREEMPRVIRQREGMKREAEQLGHEALRMSAEAEVLKRRVHELEEEVMIRDGHLSILRNSLNNNYDC